MSKNQVRFLALLLVTLTLSGRTARAQDIKPDPDLAVRLRQADVLLLRAVHTADRAPWLRFAAPDFFYLDEEGGVTYLDAFLNELEPKSTKPLEIQTFKLTRAGDTAIVLHEDTDEHQVHYIFTETWQQLKGDWRLRVLHITNVLSDPPAIQLSPDQIGQLVGTYHQGPATVTIRRDANRIIYKKADGSEFEVKAETRDVLFTPGQPRQRFVFMRDSAGDVTSFVRRYESSDILWMKDK